MSYTKQSNETERPQKKGALDAGATEAGLAYPFPSSINSPKSSIFWVIALILLAVAVRLPWVFMIPISQAPDEGAHFWVINFIYSHHRLPILTDMNLEPGASYYGAMSALSYLPQLVCAACSPSIDPALAFRFGSLVSGTASVAVAFGIGRLLFESRLFLALAVPLYMALHPQLVFVNSYSNNDSASCLIATIAMLVCVLAVKQGLTRAKSIALGIVIGSLLLSKLSNYCLIPVILASVLLSLKMHGTKIKLACLRFLEMGSLASLIAVPLFLRNMHAFNGDPIGLKTMLELWWRAYGKPEQLYHWPAIDNSNWRLCLFWSYFGNFGNMDRLLPGRLYKYYSIAINLTCAGWLVLPILKFLCAKYRPLQSKLLKRFFDLQNLEKGQAALWAVPFLCLVFAVAGVILASVSLNSTGPPQGRYLFPAEAAIAALFVGGLNRLGGRPLVAAFLILNAYACWVSFSMLYPIYHFSSNIFR